MSHDDMITIYADILQVTDSAVLADCAGEEVWLPLSQVDFNGEKGDVDVPITLPEWLADDKGLSDGDGMRRAAVLPPNKPESISSEETRMRETCDHVEGFLCYSQRELATKEAAAISKVVRNEGLRLIPQDIIDEALEVARSARRGDVTDPQERIRKVCDIFASLRVSSEDLSQYLGTPIDKASPMQIDDLQTVYTAIKSGEAKWSDYVQRDDEKTTAATSETATKLKEKLAATKPYSTSAFIHCGRNGEDVLRSACDSCPDKSGCPDLTAFDGK